MLFSLLFIAEIRKCVFFYHGPSGIAVRLKLHIESMESMIISLFSRT